MRQAKRRLLKLPRLRRRTLLLAPPPSTEGELIDAVPTGQEISGSKDKAGATEVTAGDYIIQTAPGDGDFKKSDPSNLLFFKVKAPANTRLHIATVMAAPVYVNPDAYEQGLAIYNRLAFTDSHSQACDTSVGQAFGDAMVKLAVAATAMQGQGRGSCADNDGVTTFSLERGGKLAKEKAQLPVSLRIRFEPIMNLESLPAGWKNSQVSSEEIPSLDPDPQAVRAGNGFFDATELTPGVYSLTMKPGEGAVFRVNLKYGQRLNLNYKYEPGEWSGFINSMFYQPDLNRLYLKNTQYQVKSEPISIFGGVLTQDHKAQLPNAHAGMGSPVRARNQTEGDFNDCYLPGDYYMAFSAGALAKGAPPEGIPLKIAISITGTEEAGPTYNTVATEVPRIFNPTYLVVLLAGLAVLAVGMVFVLRRRRR